ncbi:N-acetylglucosamine kinase [Austwickia chelonae]|uniref:N-acetylglucosamine kinase n=1 Tax=Austwickia chelonae TaxID=100225 RepID=UPI000E24CD53|nr:BadF/BadG/BcrA/BcrD ATPase family protein [Austwickia chelonae]
MVFLGVDIGGTTIRAVLTDAQSSLVGRGLARGGNVRSSPGDLAGHLTRALRECLDTGPMHTRPEQVCIGSAGAGPARRDEVAGAIRRACAAVGLKVAEQPSDPDTRSFSLVTDLEIAFRAAAHSPDGLVLIAGTGAVAASIRGWKLHDRRDGLGWLLGDTGSGVWLGRRVLRAVAADLDRGGAPTAMTGAVLRQLSLNPEAGREQVDPQQLIRAVDELRPAEWGQFAQVALNLAGQDEQATVIVDRAGQALATTLAAVGPVGVAGGSEAIDDVDHRETPVIFAGGLLASGPLRHRVGAGYPQAVFVPHPVVGACAAAAAAAGVELDRAALARAME